jgi:predicted ATPase
MITHLQAKNFKSWRDTGDQFKLGPLTGLFGTNSSGKTSLLQTLLMLKQTVESTDRKQVLRTGDQKSLVDLGTFSDVHFKHPVETPMEILLEWELPKPLLVKDPQEKEKLIYTIRDLRYVVSLDSESGAPVVNSFEYRFDRVGLGMKRKILIGVDKNVYELIAEGYEAKKIQGRAWSLPPPIKCYGFPDEVKAYYQNTGFLPDLVLAFERLMTQMVYLGPLREYPQRTYTWGGEEPQDVGAKGESAVPALLASRKKGKAVSRGRGRLKVTVEERVAEWLRDMELIHSFSLHQIAEHRKDYEVRVCKTATSPEVSITDVGFGVSQILPVLVLCYYVPAGTTILLEQPEIHLHPLVQSALADVFVDAVKYQKVQIVVESHSEHLLRRLQRRIADETIEAGKIQLYFCRNDASMSTLEPLQLDELGNITNWPPNFFGDEMGDLVAMTVNQRKRRPSVR